MGNFGDPFISRTIPGARTECAYVAIQIWRREFRGTERRDARADGGDETSRWG
jgi:hypothetical protein